MIDIRVEGIVKKFGNVIALDGINIYVDAGELFFLLGPSGCGKTTLLRLLAGFYTPDEGKIFFGDKEVSNVPPHKRETGMVFQSYALWPHMTVAQNIAFGLQQKKLPKKEIEEKIEETLISVKMEAFAHRKPNELSGGQQQRVALARALAVRPKCLLLDEPLSNLDAKLRTEMRTEIRRICKEFQLTTLYVTHDQAEALSIADRIAIFSKGHVEQIGSPLEVYRKPQNQFVAHFVGETNFIPGTIMHQQGNELLVRTAIGDYRGYWQGNEEPPQSGSVVLSIRPEAFRLKFFASEENSTDGMIGRTTYYGEVAHYDFIKNGVTLRISELNPKHIEHRLQKGLYANVLPENVVVLPK
ncbi:MAG: ABC transporter ATP-binding protein [Puniceicoccales bacterium]|jgi:iron(III) transport system ATP-binding protein|nr:ABC transporter ATP-binding protein [Puniceicoccales bacterium]